jgi:hypothetical protein
MAIGANLLGMVIYSYFLWQLGFDGGRLAWLELVEVIIPALSVLALIMSR